VDPSVELIAPHAQGGDLLGDEPVALDVVGKVAQLIWVSVTQSTDPGRALRRREPRRA
jgi:hypothetical protein